ncbi:hypothetical protein GGD40_006400 [Paraburkholderia bryophila]|uniref:Uncharacterized protein n=1 Tax=Paraburkholderia bryophila TaxID=420952 RepID=A0A7Y9WTE1_9BURK|nr:hypothetical protein [Paraburkholderia bryophila]
MTFAFGERTHKGTCSEEVASPERLVAVMPSIWQADGCGPNQDGW